ncbi:hypothetical protein [Xenorhabdus innexi]|uniref:Uncharacterized protein n=1 Tax=Xenorhabdus innexi TaxID=290109 RepID=A0A1N6MWU9_9GAMM|nr:hypothetical protein [Xenorhabdus innexi]PHM35948.1 hypothetical protein Xinn_02018 [Xenorhabdus innexi]SIP73247.1 exported hypothetical protein [Xenorhabdus innexi]
MLTNTVKTQKKTAATATIAAAAIAEMKKAKETVEKHDQYKLTGLTERKTLINEVYRVAKADHKLKAEVFIFYVTQIVKKGSVLETVLPFFKQEIKDMFDRGELKVTAIDNNTDECVNAEVVFNNLRRLFNAAKSRYDTAKSSSKGTDTRDDEIKAKSFLAVTKMSDIAEGFTMLPQARQYKLIKSLFLQLDQTNRMALLLELEAMKEQPIPEIDDIK